MNFLTLFITAILLNLFALITILIRPKLFGVKLFRPMIWNIKLSILPTVVLVGGMFITIITRYLATTREIDFLQIVSSILFFLTILIWLVLLPNSGYLITELNLTHREEDELEVPIWYDIISVLSLALSGVVNTLLSITLIQLLLLVILDPTIVDNRSLVHLTILSLILIVLVSIGIYFGRAIRFNSWDLVHPARFIKKLKDHFSIKNNLINSFYFILFHSAFFLIMYYAFGIPYYFIKL